MGPWTSHRVIGHGLWALALAASLGCSKRREVTQVPGPKITKVKVQGQPELSDDEIFEHISLRPSYWLGETYYYFPGSERVARSRILELYHAEGYYDAKVAPIRVLVSNQHLKMQRQRARAWIDISAGAPTHITAITWRIQGAKGEPRPIVQAPIQDQPLQVGQRFSIAALNEAKLKILAQLQDQGYPDAKVHESANVDRTARKARLNFDLDPGPRITIQAASVHGAQGFVRSYLQTLAAPCVGQRYSPACIDTLKTSIYGLGIFSQVKTSLIPTASAAQRVLRIQVTPRDPTQLALGVSANFDAAVWSQRGNLRYGHRNLFGKLAQLKLQLSLGWAQMPTTSGTWHHSPLLEVDAHLSKPSLRIPNLRWFTQLHTLSQPRENYEFWRIEGKLGAALRIGRFASLSASYNPSLLAIYSFSAERRPLSTNIETIEGQSPFLAYIELEAQAFRLDQQLAPKQGVHALLTYQWASRVLGSQSQYHRISPELRGYLHPIDWLVLAGRARVGFILPFGGSTSARIDQRFYLGGVSSVRGWPLRSLSPHATFCDGSQNCVTIPVGGNSEFLGNLEARFNVWGALDLVTFADAGDVQTKVAYLSPKDWMYTSGAGLRYVTPIGAVRLDVGIQLNHDLARFPKTRPFAVHLALGDSF